MHNKSVELVVLGYLLFAFCIPSSLGLYKNGMNTTGLISAASWDVSLNQTGINSNLEVEPNSTISYTLNVVSNSEVNTKYSIIISNIPSGVVVKLDEEENFRIPNNGTVVIDNAGIILYSAVHQNTHTLTFKANAGAPAVNNQEIDINVVFEQDL